MKHLAEHQDFVLRVGAYDAGIATHRLRPVAIPASYAPTRRTKSWCSARCFMQVISDRGNGLAKRIRPSRVLSGPNPRFTSSPSSVAKRYLIGESRDKQRRNSARPSGSIRLSTKRGWAWAARRSYWGRTRKPSKPSASPCASIRAITWLEDHLPETTGGE